MPTPGPGDDDRSLSTAKAQKGREERFSFSLGNEHAIGLARGEAHGGKGLAYPTAQFPHAGTIRVVGLPGEQVMAQTGQQALARI